MRGIENLAIIALFFKFYNIRQLTVYRQFSRKTKPFRLSWDNHNIFVNTLFLGINSEIREK